MSDQSAGGGPELLPDPRRLIGGVIGRVAPAVIRQIDMDAVIDQLDVNAIAERLDIDALVARIDVNVIAEQLDLDALVSRLDVNAIAEELDLDALVGRLDVNAIAEQLDIDELMTRVDMAKLTAGVTGDVATSGLDLARRQLVRADATVDGVVGRVLRRSTEDRPVAPALLAPAIPQTASGESETDDTEPDVLPGTRAPGRRSVSGHYAGSVTRTLSLLGDVFAALAAYSVASAGALYLFNLVFGTDTTLSSGGWVARVLLVGWMLLWFWLPVGVFACTPVMALVGLAVVRRDGDDVGPRRAFLRAIITPISFVVLLFSAIGVAIGRERRMLHDVAAGTVVVYDWGEREAEQPATIRDQLSARVRRRRMEEGENLAESRADADEEPDAA